MELGFLILWLINNYWELFPAWCCVMFSGCSPGCSSAGELQMPGGANLCSQPVKTSLHRHLSLLPCQHPTKIPQSSGQQSLGKRDKWMSRTSGVAPGDNTTHGTRGTDSSSGRVWALAWGGIHGMGLGAHPSSTTDWTGFLYPLQTHNSGWSQPQQKDEKYSRCQSIFTT